MQKDLLDDLYNQHILIPAPQWVTLPVAFLRTVIRIIPFEVISGIRDECWHDKWSDTTVVRK